VAFSSATIVLTAFDGAKIARITPVGLFAALADWQLKRRCDSIYTRAALELERDHLSDEEQEQVRRRGEEACELAARNWGPRRKLFVDIAAFLELGGLAAANFFVFSRFLDVSYPRWYLTHGSIISLVFAAFTLGMNLDKESGLVSANPGDYLRATIRVRRDFGLQFKGAVGADIGREPREPPANYNLHKVEGIIKEAGFLPESMVVVVFTFAFFLAVRAWFLVIAPLQYVLYLVCGAPARRFAGSTWQESNAMPAEQDELVERKPATMESNETPLNEGELEGRKPDVLGARWKTVYSYKPVTFTATVTAIVLWVISQFI
jgi:hypothetical protein